jgi:hypothetical protein
MSTQTKQEYLRAICERYRRSSKKQKQTILDEFCQNCGYNRKYAIRLLRKTLSWLSKSRSERQRIDTPRKQAGRPKRYDDPRVLEFLMQLWRATNLACSKRLKAIIPLWLPFYDQPDVTPDVKRQLKDHLSTLDPFLLQQQISTKIKKILRLATPLQKITVANLPQNTYHPA